MDEQKIKEIHEANISVHKIESKYHEIFHPEIYNEEEQKRLFSILSSIKKKHHKEIEKKSSKRLCFL